MLAVNIEKRLGDFDIRVAFESKGSGAVAFLKFLSGGTAKTAFEKQGFSLSGPASS